MIDRRTFLQTTIAGTAGLAMTEPAAALAQGAGAAADRDAVIARIAAAHDATVKALRDWIALPSIAAENIGYPQGAEHMARLARDAGFAGVEVIPTKGKPGVFGTIDAGADTTLGVYFMHDVKRCDQHQRAADRLSRRIAGVQGRRQEAAGERRPCLRR
jgi:hypothetical protein